MNRQESLFTIHTRRKKKKSILHIYSTGDENDS